MANDVLPLLQDFAEILKSKEPLGPYTLFKVGGPAEALIQPRTVKELSAVVKRCHQHHLPMRILGVGGNVLVRDEGVKGVVLRLTAPVFSEITTQGKRVRAG